MLGATLGLVILFTSSSGMEFVNGKQQPKSTFTCLKLVALIALYLVLISPAGKLHAHIYVQNVAN